MSSKKSKRKVSEPAPVQVYLAPRERDRLEWLADRLETSKSEVLRRGLTALEEQLTDPSTHPILRLLGSAEEGRDRQDAARDHDRLLAASEEASWGDRGR